MMADTQRHEAERQEREAKRVNDANQAAILRLMNELQSVAEGDLTQQATVTEDITGAIADSVNYTVEELRGLVLRVIKTTEQVTRASSGAGRRASGITSQSDCVPSMTIGSQRCGNRFTAGVQCSASVSALTSRSSSGAARER